MPRPDRDVIREAVQRRDVRALARAFFGVRLTRGQARIVRAVAFREHRRLIINAYTRYGKTWSVALGICLLILLDRRPLKIRLVGPTKEQASILRGYIADLIQVCKPLQDMLDLEAKGVRRLKKEVSKSRYTFRDGKDLRVLSAEGGAKRIMGFGGDVIVLDESCLLHPEAWPKIARMLAESPDSMLVEMSNPWHKDNHYHKHWISPRYHRIHIGWKQGVREGRITREFVDEQREECTLTEFQILWKSVFPDTAESQLIPWSWIKRAEQGDVPSPELVRQWTDQYGLDVAGGGTDRTILTRLRLGTLYGDKGTFVDVQEQWETDFADTMETADWAAAIMPPGTRVVVDANGVGKGVADRLKRLGYKVVHMEAGAGARRKKRFTNMKAEVFWDTRTSFEKNLVHIPRRHAWARRLTSQLSSYRWRLKKGRIEVYEETKKSPDHGDSCAYGMHGRSRRKIGVG